MKKLGIVLACVVGFALGVMDFSLASAQTRILFVADSHGVGPFGILLDEKLRGLPETEVLSYARCGSSPDWWFSGRRTTCGYLDRPVDRAQWRRKDPGSSRTPLLKTLLETEPGRYQRHVTVVELGTNQIHDDPKEAVASLKRFAELIVKSGSECVWVGPPKMRRFSTAQLEKVYGWLSGLPCQIVDSRKYTEYPEKGGDGIHFEFPAGRPQAQAWAKGVCDEVAGQKESE